MIGLQHEVMQWKTNDGLTLFAQRWEPEKTVKGTICLVHGLGEHSSRYWHWAEKFTESDYALAAFDLRGHGQSEGQPGYTPSFDHLTDDVSLLLNDMENRFPGKPRFLYGHSFGGLIALFYLLQRQPQLAGCIATSPLLKVPAQDQKAKMAAVKILGAIAPKVSIPNGVDKTALSRDKAVIEKYANDPLVHDRLPLGMAKGMSDSVTYLYANAAGINQPLLLMHGTEDRITYISGTEKFAPMVSGECTFKRWEGCYHELHNEPEKDDVFEYLREWVDNRPNAAK